MPGVVLIALAMLGAAGGDDEVVAPLAERIRAAPLIVEGIAGRGEAAWDGADAATIVTRTPFTVTQVLKGTLASRSIVLRQPGGAVGGAERPAAGAAQFEDGEHAFVLVGAADPRDGSYDVTGGAQGKYHITTDAQGRDGLDVRLGVDAGAYTSREKAPGTLLGRVPAELFVRLAQGGPGGRGTTAAAAVAVAPSASADQAAVDEGAAGGAGRTSPKSAMRVAGLLIAAGIAVTMLVLRLRRRRTVR